MSKEYFDVQQINAISIVSVARKLGKIKRAGSVYKTLCPWHNDTTPSLTLYERTNENRCHCFACGAGGSVIDYVMKHENWTFQEACRWLSNEYGILTKNVVGYVPRPKARAEPEPVAPEYTYIPMPMLEKMVSTENSLCKCLMKLFHPEAVRWVTEEYMLGAYAMGKWDDYTVFPCIDKKGRVCNLKVQHYDTDISSNRFAHSDPNSCMWLGTIWAREGLLPKDSVFRSSCMFGEHLLAKYPEGVVILVESPKNALFGALEHQDLIWLATGSKNMLKRDVLEPLRGRDVLVIPDRDAIDEWRESISDMADIANFSVSDLCNRVAPDQEAKYDVADYILQEHLVLPF